MQEIFQNIQDNMSQYSRLYSFALQLLTKKECGLYEATDLLLGNPLYTKSVEVKYIDIMPPSKGTKTFKQIQFLHETEGPDCTDI